MANNIMKGKEAIEASNRAISELTPVQKDLFWRSIDRLEELKGARGLKISSLDRNAAYRSALNGSLLSEEYMRRSVENATARMARGLQDAQDVRNYNGFHRGGLLGRMRDPNTAFGAAMAGIAGAVGYGLGYMADANQKYMNGPLAELVQENADAPDAADRAFDYADEYLNNYDPSKR